MTSTIDEWISHSFKLGKNQSHRSTIWSVTGTNLGLTAIRPLEGEDGIQETVFTMEVAQPSVSGRSCRTCGLVFNSLESQKLHYKSPLHRTNLQRQMRGLPSKTEATELKGEDDVDESDESDSDGSDSDGGVMDDKEDEEEEDPTKGVGVDKFGAQDSVLEGKEGKVTWCPYNSRDGVQITFRGDKAEKWDFSVNSVVLTSWLQIKKSHAGEEEGKIINPWSCLKSSLVYHTSHPVWCVFILRSGRFAGAIFDGNTVLEHKTLRRYTVRAKAGGGQSSHDNKGGKALSAGAMLRRYGEEALKEDVKGLLRAWRGHLAVAGVILFSVPKTMRSIMFGEDSDAPLRKKDKRVVNVPFLVRLPTFEEAQHIHARISSVIFTKQQARAAEPKIEEAQTALSTISESMPVNDLARTLEELATEYRMKRQTRQEQKRRRAKRKETVLSPLQMTEAEAEYAANAHPLSIRLLALLKDLKSHSTTVGGDEDDTEAVLATVAEVAALEPEVAAAVLRHTDNLQDMHSALHLASECGKVAVVEALLMAGSDPGASDGMGRSPYFVARDKATRDTFRRCRGAIEQSLKEGSVGWDWDAAGVGPGISEEGEAAKKEAQREKERERKKRAKLRKQAEKKKEAQQIADLALAKELQEKEAAAEAEQRRLSAGECGHCGKSLYLIKVFPLQDCKCCSAACVLQLRRRLAAEAAERRFGK